MRLCKDCIHFKERQEWDTLQGKLMRSWVVCKIKICEPVRGEMVEPECSYARSNFHDAKRAVVCGPDAFFWQARSL